MTLMSRDKDGRFGTQGNGGRPRVLFFTGTDTDVGKTYVAGLTIAELRHSGRCVAAYKPVASGCHEESGELVSGDAIALWEATGRRDDLRDVCPQRFRAPLAPPAAAALEGQRVCEERMTLGFAKVARGADCVVVEGAGGLFSPLSEDMFNADLARRLGGDLVIVAPNRLGVIHQVLVTSIAAATAGLRVLGVILSSPHPKGDLSVGSNGEAIRQWGGVRLLAEVGHGASSTGIDWKALLSNP